MKRRVCVKPCRRRSVCSTRLCSRCWSPLGFTAKSNGGSRCLPHTPVATHGPRPRRRPSPERRVLGSGGPRPTRRRHLKPAGAAAVRPRRCAVCGSGPARDDARPPSRSPAECPRRPEHPPPPPSPPDPARPASERALPLLLAVEAARTSGAVRPQGTAA